jgi:ABC-type branched-subunit amino acid transport system substrate-binding protein
MDARAEPGVQAESVTFAMLAGLSGPAAGPAKAASAMLQAQFADLNAKGGINGRKLRLLEADDAADPQQARSALEKLEAGQAMFALVLARSGPVIDALLPVLDKSGIPLVGAVGGSKEAYEGDHRSVFLLRPSFGRETEEACRLASNMGIGSVLTVVPQNSAGNEMLQGVQDAMKKGHVKMIDSLRYDARTLDTAKIVQQIQQHGPMAVLVGGPPKPVASIIIAAKARGVSAWFITQSNNSSGDFIQSLGHDTSKVIVSQVFPNPQAFSVLARDFQRVAAKANLPPDYAAFEAFVTAQVMIEGLKRAGRNPTRARFIEAIGKMKSLDLGGFVVSFDRNQRVGNGYVELTLLNHKGQFIR